MLRTMTAMDAHEFWPDELDCVAADFPLNLRIGGHRQVTDAYLVSLARARSGCLVTLDRRIRRVLPLEDRSSQYLRIIESG